MRLARGVVENEAPQLYVRVIGFIPIFVRLGRTAIGLSDWPFVRNPPKSPEGRRRRIKKGPGSLSQAVAREVCRGFGLVCRPHAFLKALGSQREAELVPCVPDSVLCRRVQVAVS